MTAALRSGRAGAGRAGGSSSNTDTVIARTDAAADRAATIAGRAGQGTEGTDATITCSAGIGAERRRVNFAQAERPLNFSKLLCLSLRPCRLAPLGSPRTRGEGDLLVRFPNAGAARGRSWSRRREERGGRGWRGGLRSRHCHFRRAYLENTYIFWWGVCFGFVL